MTMANPNSTVSSSLSEESGIIIACSAGAAAIICFIIAVSCVCYYRMGCCKSRSTGNTYDVEAKGASKDSSPQKDEDTSQEIEKKTFPEQNGHKRTSSKRTNSETENEKSKEVQDEKTHDNQPDSSQILEENGTLPTEGSEVKESNTDEERMSVIYAKPDKRQATKNTINQNDTVPHVDNGNMENETELGSCSDLNATESGSITIQSKSSDHEDSETMPEVLYAKPMKNRDKDVNDESSTPELQPENRISFGDDYATIHDTLASSEKEPPKKGSEEMSAYEDVKLGNMAPPAHDNLPRLPSDDLTRPPPLPSDSLTRPPRHPSTEKTQGAEHSVLGTPMPEPPDEVFLPVTGKSSSVRQHASPYAQTQLVPRAQSTKARSHSNRSNEEETMVELGTPGIKKPSIKVPGSPSAILDIPDEEDNPDYESVTLPSSSEASQPVIKTSKHPNSSNDKEPMVELGTPGTKKPSIKIPGSPPAIIDIPDEEDNPDYERVVLPSSSESSQPVSQTSEHPRNKTGDEDSGWVENTIYSSAGNPNRDSAIEDEESPELVTYEQTNFLGVKNQNKSDLIEEDDYEEIRRSRLAQFEDDELSEQTTSQTIDGKVVPVTEL